MNDPAPQRPPIPVALCLGGVDPSCGAGLFRDALTLASLGIHPLGVSVAETVQSGLGCHRIEPPAVEPLDRLEALQPHLQGAWGVKLGMCALDFPRLAALLARVADWRPSFRIWDPVQAPTLGTALHSGADLRCMADVVLKNGKWIVAPNRVEAATLLESDRSSTPDVLAKPWLEAGAQAVWLKGGHDAGGEVEDFWITPTETRSLGRNPRLLGERRGTGCTVASAWLGFRLRGSDEAEAAIKAISWIRDRWERAFVPGGAGRPVFAPENA